MKPQLWIVYRLSLLKLNGNPLFRVTYMQWETFKDILAQQDQRLSHILQHDCLLGGIDYTINYR